MTIRLDNALQFYILYCKVGTKAEIKKVALKIPKQAKKSWFFNLNTWNQRKHIIYSLSPFLLPSKDPEYVDYPRSCYCYLVPVVGGGREISLHCCPSCSQSLICMRSTSDYSIQMNNCLPGYLLPGNWITNEDNSRYLTY